MSSHSNENRQEAVCRLCTAKRAKTINVFEAKLGEADLTSIICQYLDIEISKKDELPKDVCIPCFEKLSEFFEFYTLCADSQISLTVVYGTRDEGPCNKDQFALNSGVGVDETSNTFNEVHDGAAREQGSKWQEIKFNSQGDKFRNEVGKKRNEVAVINIDEDESDLSEATEEAPVITTKEVFENYTWECSDCNKTLVTLSALKLHHAEVHKQSPHFKCAECGKIFAIYRSFVRHVKIHNQPGRFQCNTCEKKFSQKNILQSHMMLHTNLRPHVCSQCGKAFKQTQALHIHMNSHLPEQARSKFICPVCRKSFSSKQRMQNHLKLHTGERDFACDICGKKFISNGSLNYHVQTHAEQKTHSCGLCSKSFRTAKLLAKHASLHSGVKSHQCDVCGKQFRERSALTEHSRIHTGEMPYVCEYCGKAFRFKGILTVHIRQHTGERPYKCDKCERTFANWANWNKHTRAQHGQKGSAGTSNPSPAPVSLPSMGFVDTDEITLSTDEFDIEFDINAEIFNNQIGQNEQFNAIPQQQPQSSFGVPFSSQSSFQFANDFWSIPSASPSFVGNPTLWLP